MKQFGVVLLAAGVIGLGGCETAFSPATERELARQDAERQEADARVEAVRTEIEAELDQQREEAKEIDDARIDIQRTYEHAGVDYRFDLAQLDVALGYSQAAAQANIEAFGRKLTALADQRARLEADWDRRLADAQATDDLYHKAVGFGLGMIPTVGVGFAALWNGRRQYRRGTESTAADFRDAIAQGRTDPNVNAMVTGDTPLGNALRGLMRRRPDVEKVVKEGDKRKPVNPAEVQA